MKNDEKRTQIKINLDTVLSYDNKQKIRLDNFRGIKSEKFSDTNIKGLFSRAFRFKKFH